MVEGKGAEQIMAFAHVRQRVIRIKRRKSQDRLSAAYDGVRTEGIDERAKDCRCGAVIDQHAIRLHPAWRGRAEARRVGAEYVGQNG